MSKSRILSTVLGVAVAWCSTRPARASLVTWEFAGHLTDVTDVAGVLPDTITVGTPFFGSYTFESETADTLPGDPSEGVYPAVTDIQVELDSIVLAGPIGPRSIGIGLGSAVFPSQTYGTNIGVELDGGAADSFLTLRTDDRIVFMTDALPIKPPALELFDSAIFLVTTRDKSLELQGVVSSLIPEPWTLGLLGLGAGCLAARVRRTKGLIRQHTRPRRATTANRSILLLAPGVALLCHVRALAIDCSNSKPSDECAINCEWPRCHLTPCGDAADCNDNRISDTCEMPTCQPIEVVFLMDVSESVGMDDPTVDQLCDEITLALDSFAALIRTDRSALIAFLRTLRTPTTSPQRGGR